MGASWADWKLSFQSVIVSYSMQQQWTTSPLDYDVTKSGFYTTSSDGCSGWTEKKLQSCSQSQTCTQKRVTVTVWWPVAHQIHYSFRNPHETIMSEKNAQQINRWDASKNLQRLQLALRKRKGPILLHDNTQPHATQPTLQKSNKLGYEVLPSPSYSPDFSATDYHFFEHLKNFLQGK